MVLHMFVVNDRFLFSFLYCAMVVHVYHVHVCMYMYIVCSQVRETRSFKSMLGDLEEGICMMYNIAVYVHVQYKASCCCCLTTKDFISHAHSTRGQI